MRYLLLLLLVGCETPYNKDDLALTIDAQSKDGECRIVIESEHEDHQVAEGSIPEIVDVVTAGVTP